MKQNICKTLILACFLLLLSINTFATSCASIPPELAEAYAIAQANYQFYSKIFFYLSILLLTANLVFLVATKRWILAIALFFAGTIFKLILFYLLIMGINACGGHTQYFGYETFGLLILLFVQVAWSARKKKIDPQDQKILSVFDE